MNFSYLDPVVSKELPKKSTQVTSDVCFSIFWRILGARDIFTLLNVYE